MIRVLHATWSLGLGGAEALLVDLANRQSADCVSGILIGNAIVDDQVAATVSPAVEVLRVDRPPGSRNPWHLFRLRRAVRRWRPDIVHAHNASLIDVLPASGIARVLTVHDTRLDLPASVMRYDRVFSISEAVRSDLASRSPAVESRVVPNGIDFDAFRPVESPGAGPALRLVQVSRLVLKKKGQDIVVGALQELRADPAVPAVRVDFIGEGPDERALAERIESAGLGDACRILGPRSRAEVARLLPTYDGLVQPSRFEGFGLTIVEAVAAGLPVLVADLEGPREILAHLAHGYTFTPGDASDCARQIRRIAADRARPEFRLQRLADRSALRERYDVAATSAAYLAGYRQVLADRARRAG
jgi:glycosyltransferase involved in cell wall biosynthesis